MAKKVLRIINRFNLGGPTYNVAYLTKYLAPEYETLLVGGMKDESEASSDYIINKLGIEPIIVEEMKRSINPVNDYLAYKKIKNIIKEFKPDIVHTHASKAGTLGRIAAAHCNVPVIVHTFHGHVFHSYFNQVKTTVFKEIERYLAKKSSAIISISEIQQKELALDHKIAPLEKIKVVPLGFDLDRFQENKDEKRKTFREKYQVKENEIAIGIIGRLVPVKNHSLFIQAISYALKHTQKSIRAFIIGDGEMRESMINEIKNLDVSYSTPDEQNNKAHITFTSWIKDADWALAGLDILCLTSFNEGTPVSLIEAQAASKAIVSTNVGGIENIVLKNETALLSEINDPEGFFKNLVTLIENDHMRKAFTNKGWDFVRNKFHYKRLVSDVDELYKQLLAQVK